MHLLHHRRLAGAAILALGLGISGVSAQELHQFADTSRLVSIGGSLTEIIYALGEEGKLVARDQTALYPEAVTSLPDVGYMRQLAPEGVLSVSPTALLVIEGSGPPEALEVLSHAGVEYQTVPESYSAEGVLAKIRAVGHVLGAADKAETLAAATEQQFATVAQLLDARVDAGGVDAVWPFAHQAHDAGAVGGVADASGG